MNAAVRLFLQIGVIWLAAVAAFAAVMWWSTRSTSVANKIADASRDRERRIAHLRRRRDEYEREARAREQVQ